MRVKNNYPEEVETSFLSSTFTELKLVSPTLLFVLVEDLVELLFSNSFT